MVALEDQYLELLKTIKPNRKLGQCFLTSRSIAKSEANFGIGKSVVEMGPGLGILTRELCRTAEKVLSIEKDSRLYGILKSSLKSKKLSLVNSDFFEVPKTRFRGIDIMISNVPYVLSSKTVFWLARMRMPAVLCLQREFVGHMLATAGSNSYSRLSVMSSLSFTITKIFDVPNSDFYPRPNVSSSLIHMKPKGTQISGNEAAIIGALMMHKKKTARNAIIDSSEEFGMKHSEIKPIASNIRGSEKRPFQLKPNELLEMARELADKISE